MNNLMNFNDLLLQMNDDLNEFNNKESEEDSLISNMVDSKLPVDNKETLLDYNDQTIIKNQTNIQSIVILNHLILEFLP